MAINGGCSAPSGKRLSSERLSGRGAMRCFGAIRGCVGCLGLRDGSRSRSMAVGGRDGGLWVLDCSRK